MLGLFGFSFFFLLFYSRKNEFVGEGKFWLKKKIKSILLWGLLYHLVGDLKEKNSLEVKRQTTSDRLTAISLEFENQLGLNDGIYIKKKKKRIEHILVERSDLYYLFSKFGVSVRYRIFIIYFLNSLFQIGIIFFVNDKTVSRYCHIELVILFYFFCKRNFEGELHFIIILFDFAYYQNKILLGVGGGLLFQFNFNLICIYSLPTQVLI